jgi:hypothetical protein
MTSDRFDITMRDWLAHRGAGRAPDYIHATAMTTIGSHRQRSRRWAAIRVGMRDAQPAHGVVSGTTARLVAAVALTLLVGAVLGFVIGSRPAVLPVPTQSTQPTESPRPTPSASVEPTPGQSPAAGPTQSVVPTSTAPTPSGQVQTSTFIRPFVYPLPSRTTPKFRLVKEDAYVVGFGLVEPLSPFEDYGRVQSNSRRGIAVFSVGWPFTHGCVDGGPAFIEPLPGEADTPSAFLALVVGQVEAEPVTSTTLDGRPALTTSFQSGHAKCGGDIHYDHGSTPGSRYVSISIASQMIAFQVADRTIVVDIWARDDAEFEAWLPNCQRVCRLDPLLRALKGEIGAGIKKAAALLRRPWC